ncbi:hypothetical protein GCU69_04520 [Streptomyces lycii]|uniref:Histidine kinase/HSP90-like ATPase domain-containing protein n=2 Tax=Streptomyces TaxID=1883 RepID=A0ABQ7FNQ4_9ACTN|nr:hypothetical protein GCU69_04520 [Streptomyces lycii]
MSIAPKPCEVRRIRKTLTDVLRSWGLGSQTDEVLLVVSELVTNAIRHAPCSEILCTAARLEGALVVEVEDGNDREPVVRCDSGDETEDGRGLLLVRSLTSELGWTSLGAGRKRTRAVIPVLDRCSSEGRPVSPFVTALSIPDRAAMIFRLALRREQSEHRLPSECSSHLRQGGAMTTFTPARASARSLLPDEFFARLVDRIAEKEGTDRLFAERVMEQALGFLAACAKNVSGRPLSPSPVVDIGWHTFLLHTRQYAEFCDKVAGRFIHHEPYEATGARHDDPQEVRLRTQAAMEAAGYVVDHELWSGAAACDQGGAPRSCGDDGGGGNPPDCGHVI